MKQTLLCPSAAHGKERDGRSHTIQAVTTNHAKDDGRIHEHCETTGRKVVWIFG